MPVPIRACGASLVAQVVKNPPAMQETGFGPWVGKIPWRRNDNPLQYSCLENSMDRGAERAAVHGAAENWTQLRTHTLKRLLIFF